MTTPTPIDTPILRLRTFVPERQTVVIETEDGPHSVHLKRWDDLSLQQQVNIGQQYGRIQAIEAEAIAAYRGDREPLSPDEDAEHHRLAVEIARTVLDGPPELVDAVCSSREQAAAVASSFFSVRAVRSARAQEALWLLSMAERLRAATDAGAPSTSNGSLPNSNTTGRSRTRKRG